MQIMIDPDNDSIENMKLISKIIEAKIIDRKEPENSDAEEVLKEVISHLERKLGRALPIMDILVEMEKRGIDSEGTNRAIMLLKREGEIFEPRKGLIQRL